MSKNKKSDAAAKNAYIKCLEAEGYNNAHISASPADIIAEKNGETFYFEIKMTKTANGKAYFGAATLTEWHQALQTPEHFWFVVAYTDEEEKKFTFKKFTPDEFMLFSTIPPFKIFFNIPASGIPKVPSAKSKKRKTSVPATKEVLTALDVFYQNMKNQVCQ